MTNVEFHKKHTEKCKKCSKWLMCRKHQNLWIKLVTPTSPKLEFEDPKQEQILKKFF